MTISVSAFSLFILFALYFATVVQARPGIVPKGPAPTPKENPSSSTHANDGKNILPYQIISIVGGYVVFTGSILTLLFTVGRRLRRRVQTSNRSLDMEMVKPKAGTGDTPVSPIDMKTWPSPTSPVKQTNMTWTNPSGHRPKPSDVSSFDDKVLETDRIRNQTEMDRLYAAVAVHDAQRFNAATVVNGLPSPSPSDGDPSPTKRNPPELQHLKSASQQPLSHPLAPTSPPPNSSFNQPQSPSRQSSRASISSRLTKASPLSFLHSRASSSASQKSSSNHPNRISVRGLPISPPMGSPDLANSIQEQVQPEDARPLSPRKYTPGPPPPTPGRTPRTATAALPPPMAAPPGKRAPPPSAIKTATATTNSSTSTLPFRAAYSTSLASAPPTKTTFLERRESQLNPAPRTGQPVPYSPYQPFTPVTPFSPGRLVDKDERKRIKKEGKLKVLDERDMVASDEDMWGDSWKG
ncbi:MAG: hypothetical protein Q9160_006352 [Pyrenula sp. 1 TL-2023]